MLYNIHLKAFIPASTKRIFSFYIYYPNIAQTYIAQNKILSTGVFSTHPLLEVETLFMGGPDALEGWLDPLAIDLDPLYGRARPHRGRARPTFEEG